MGYLMSFFWRILVLSIVCSCGACTNDDYSPKPRGFFKIELPEKVYQPFVTGCPYDFEIPDYALVVDDRSSNAKPCWKNVDFPQFNARLHISYFAIDAEATFDMLTEDARTFVFKHISKATAIDQQQIADAERKIYGLRYEISGNTASNIQFYLSDSTDHYLRGALYFNEKPNIDSIKPVLEFVKKDIDHIIGTIQWK